MLHRCIFSVLVLVASGPLIWLFREQENDHSILGSQSVITHTVERQLQLVASKSRHWPLELDPIEFRYLSHAIIDEEHKLLICAIPKVSADSQLVALGFIH